MSVWKESASDCYVLTGSKSVIRNADDSKLTPYIVGSKLRLTLPTFLVALTDQRLSSFNPAPFVEDAMVAVLSFDDATNTLRMFDYNNGATAKGWNADYAPSDTLAYATIAPYLGIANSATNPPFPSAPNSNHYCSDAGGDSSAHGIYRVYTDPVPGNKYYYGALIAEAKPVATKTNIFTFVVGDTIIVIDSLGQYYKATVVSKPANNTSAYDLYNTGSVNITYGYERLYDIVLSTVKKSGSLTTSGGVKYPHGAPGTYPAGSIGVGTATDEYSSTVTVTVKAANALTVGTDDMFTGFDAHYGLTMERLLNSGFSGTPLTGVSPKKVQFTDSSDG